MKQLDGRVTQNRPIAADIYKMTLSFSEEIGEIKSGQFLTVATGGDKNLLKRPFGIIKSDKFSATFCYQIKGGGTKTLSLAKEGDVLSCVLPLGNGFDVPKNRQKIALVGGGIGVFPLLSVIDKHSSAHDIMSFFGFKNKESICLDGEACTPAVIATDDGSFGEKSNAVRALFDFGAEEFDLILACGPSVMLSALKSGLSGKNIKIKTYVSVEERMGCGIGACLTCTCDKSDGSKARVCKDGPVFDIWEVEL